MRLISILALVSTLVLAAPAAALDEAGTSAVAFLGEATAVTRDGRGNRILVALRDLKDPALTPLYAHLAASPRAPLQVHGMLGLAEVSPQRRLDLARLAEIEQPAVQAQIVTAAMDLGLLDDEGVTQLLAWQGLDPSVKLLAALRRFGASGSAGADLLHEALQSDQLGRRGLAALMLHQLGDAAGTNALAEINASADPERDVARAMLLQAAVKHGFDRIGPWAHAIAVDPATDETLGLLALRTAIRFGERRGVELWQSRFAATDDAAARMRLALTALNVASWSPATLFDPLRASDDPVLRQIGDTGATIAAAGPGGGDVAEQVVALLLLHHPYTNAWAIEYAEEWATPGDAQLIFLGLIKAFEHGPRNTRQRRVDETVRAARLLHERFPAVAGAIVRPMLADPGTGPLTKQAILLGLVQSDTDATDLASTLPPLADPELASVALVLKATTRAPLTEAELADLRLLARGGAALREELRAQAAWAYLARTGQAQEAVAAIAR